MLVDFFVLLDCFQVNDIPVNSFHNIVSSPTATLQYVLIWYTNGMHDRSSIVPLRYNNDKQKKPLFSRGLSVCRLLFNSFSKLKIDENYKEKRRLFY